MDNAPGNEQGALQGRIRQGQGQRCQGTRAAVARRAAGIGRRQRAVAPGARPGRRAGGCHAKGAPSRTSGKTPALAPPAAAAPAPHAASAAGGTGAVAGGPRTAAEPAPGRAWPGPAGTEPALERAPCRSAGPAHRAGRAGRRPRDPDCGHDPGCGHDAAAAGGKPARRAGRAGGPGRGRVPRCITRDPPRRGRAPSHAAAAGGRTRCHTHASPGRCPGDGAPPRRGSPCSAPGAGGRPSCAHADGAGGGHRRGDQLRFRRRPCLATTA